MAATRVWQGLLALLLAGVSAGLAAGGKVDSEVGQRIYRNGLNAQGVDVRAEVQRGVPLVGREAACVNCHRRSGYGGSEGRTVVRSLVGKFGPAASPSRSRTERFVLAAGATERVSGAHSYSVAALARALREGLDPAGRPLDPLMPRYLLDEGEIASLHAYLASLSGASPGVDDATLHVATILAPGAPADRSRAMLEVLRAFIADKNGESRQETRRREVSREPMYRAHRRWSLHVWELRGPSETWSDQLAAHYRRQPVFAVIGGLGQGTWAPVHRFCEATGTPCVFPDVDDPEDVDNAHYSIYFSRGVALEADVLATHLMRTSPVGRIVQIYRGSSRGQAPANRLREALQAHGWNVQDVAWQRDSPPPEFPETADTTLILWLDEADLQSLSGARSKASIYVSASLAPALPQGLPTHWRGNVRIVSPFVPAAERQRRLVRLRAWMRARRIPFVDERTQAHAFFAATIAAEAVSHLKENFSRDYFIERIEQMAESFSAPSLYPHPSLGPGQRYASRGAYLFDVAPGTGMPAEAGVWIVP